MSIVSEARYLLETIFYDIIKKIINMNVRHAGG
jgi:hypothetical protein